METQETRITVNDIDIPFGRLVTIILKVMLASIPALIVFYALFFAIALAIMMTLGAGTAIFQNFHH